MAINLKINVDSTPISQLKKQLDDVNSSINDIGNEGLDNFNQDVKETNDNLGTTVKTIASLEEQLSKLNTELSNTEIGSKAFKDLETQVIRTSGELKNLELARESLDNEQFAGELKSVAGGLGDVAGGLALVGVSGESAEKVVQTFAKVEGITKLATGAIEAYSSGVKVLNALSTKSAAVQSLMALATGQATVAQTASAVATGVATGAMTIFNAVVSANPIFLLIGAIGAVVAAFAIFGSSTRDVAAENDALNASLERQSEALDRVNEKAKRNGENRLNLARAAGASEKELLQIQLDNIDSEEKGRKKLVTVAEREIKAKRKLYKEARDQEDNEEAKKIKGEIDATRKKYKDLVALDGQYIIDKKILTTEADTKEKQDDDKANEELRKKQNDAYKKRLEDQKRYNQERLDAARRIKDLELALLEDGEDKEKQLAAEATKRALEDLQRKYGDRNKLNATLQAEFDKQSELLTIQGEEAQNKITDKFQKQKEKDLKEGQDKLNKINLDTLESGRDKEIKVREAAFDKEKEDLDKLLTDKKISFIEYQEALEKITEKGREDIDAINDKYDIEAADKDKVTRDAKLKQEEEDRKKRIDAIKSSLDETAAVFDKLGSDIGNAFAGALGNAFSQISAQIDVFTNEESTKVEKLIAGVQAASAIASGFIAAKQQEDAEKLEEGNANIDEANQKEIESLQKKFDAGLISQEQFDKSKKDLEDKAVADKNAIGKKAFEQSKKLQIAQAAISGLQGAIGAYTSLASIPVVGVGLGIAAAAAVAGFTAKNIAKIKSTQFESASVGGDSPSTTPSSGGGNNQTAQPSFSLFGQGNNANTVGPGSEQGQLNQNMTIQAQVSVSEINSVQNKVAVQEQRSSL